MKTSAASTARDAHAASPARDAHAADLFEELLRRGHSATLRARGGSMWPSLRDGDVVTVAPARSVRRGEIVAVRCGDALVLHRAVSVEPGGAQVVLRGDSLPAADGKFALDEILGRVVSVRRGARTLAPGRGRLAFAGRLWQRIARRVRAA